MAKIKYTKNELKVQKSHLKRFIRYLPTLVLKKQQLQLEIMKLHHKTEELQNTISKLETSVNEWVDLFAEDVGIKELISLDNVITTQENIAGIDIPVFKEVEFKIKEYDLLTTPLWIDSGIDAVKRLSTLKLELLVFEKQVELISAELRVTTQRVNLFEKVKIPEARENIRRINIVLGDMQTAAVVTGKIAKRKIEARGAELIQI